MCGYVIRSRDSRCDAGSYDHEWSRQRRDIAEMDANNIRGGMYLVHGRLPCDYTDLRVCEGHTQQGTRAPCSHIVDGFDVYHCKPGRVVTALS